MESRVLKSIQDGSGPESDGWGWLYSAFDSLAPAASRLRRTICAYFAPTRLEAAKDGRLFRLLGVTAFGRFIPTGGVFVRRVTGARMSPYTLSASTLSAAKDFYYRTCVFEILHLPFFLALLAISIDRLISGRFEHAVQDMVINLCVNVYPILHHRNTRRRILHLLVLKARMSSET